MFWRKYHLFSKKKRPRCFKGREGIPGPRLPGWGGRGSSPAQGRIKQENILVFRTEMMPKSSGSDKIQVFLESIYAQRWCLRGLIVE